MEQIWFQNRSIEFEVVRLDRCCCPIALTIAVPNPLSHLFWRLHAITNFNLNVSHSTRFLLFLSNSQVSPKFKDSMLRAPFTHKAQIWCVITEVLDDFCHALHFVVTHACTTLCRTYSVPLQVSPKKFEKHAFYVETSRRNNGTDLVSKPINWIWSCALRSLLLPHSSDDCSSKSLRRAFVTPILAITCDYQL